MAFQSVNVTVRHMPSRTEKTLQEHHRLLEYERRLWSDGYRRIAGLDEAGAGPWAGPVSAGCVILDESKLDTLVGVTDSKKLSHEKRVQFAKRIEESAFAYSVAIASPDEIDQINIRQASLLAMRRALQNVIAQCEQVDYLLIDARKLEDIKIPQENIIRGDSTSLSIAAASILAKVHRDEIMFEAAKNFPGYGFEKHKGYGTKQHQEALDLLGVTPIHRKSFAPVRMRIEAE